MPVFNTIYLKVQVEIIYYCQFDNKWDLHPKFIKLCNTMNCVLAMNEMQKFIVEKVSYSLSHILNSNCDWIKDQLLLYICGKDVVKKNRVIHSIKLEYTLLLWDSDLIIIAPTDATADNIDGSTIYTSLIIRVKNRYEKSNTIFNL